MENRQSGFTMVELIVVILILGVLAATALPRFINLNDKAYKAAVTATGGALGTAVSLAKAQWIANGHTDFEANLDGFGDGTVDVNDDGWAIGTGHSAVAATLTDAHCLQVWDALLSNPPKAANATAAGVEFVAKAAPAPSGGGTAPKECHYTYERDNNYVIKYAYSNGSVSVETP